jgi:hypothetical protein
MTDGATGRCWGHLGDISLGGFYVSTFGPWALNTEVRFKIEVEGKEICGTGVIATSHPGVGMAVVIKEISEECRQTLDEVVASLEKASEGPTGIGLRV